MQPPSGPAPSESSRASAARGSRRLPSRAPLFALAFLAAVVPVFTAPDNTTGVQIWASTSPGSGMNGGATDGTGAAATTGTAPAGSSAPRTRTTPTGAPSLRPPAPGVYRFDVIEGDGRPSVARVGRATRRGATWVQVSSTWFAGADEDRDRADVFRLWASDAMYSTGRLVVRNGEQARCEYDVPIAELPFPLKAGAARKTQGTCGGLTETTQVEILGRRTVRIGGSPLQTWLVERRSVVGGVTTLQRSWFSPRYRLFVQLQLGMTAENPDGYMVRLRSVRPG